MSGIFDVLGAVAPKSTGSPNGTSILMQAIGAAMRGESPQVFMKRLATQHPQLKQLDLDNLQGTANTLCQQKGVDAKQLAGQIGDVISSVKK